MVGHERADDAVQQTFVNAFNAMHRNESELDLKPWLYRIAHNASLNALRDRAPRNEPLDPEHPGAERPDQVLERRERFDEVLAAVHRLPERQRDAIVLRELEGRSYDEIALALGVGGGAVRALLNRARNSVRLAATAVTPVGLLMRIPPGDGPERRRCRARGGAARPEPAPVRWPASSRLRRSSRLPWRAVSLSRPAPATCPRPRESRSSARDRRPATTQPRSRASGTGVARARRGRPARGSGHEADDHSGQGEDDRIGAWRRRFWARRRGGRSLRPGWWRRRQFRALATRDDHSGPGGGGTRARPRAGTADPVAARAGAAAPAAGKVGRARTVGPVAASRLRRVSGSGEPGSGEGESGEPGSGRGRRIRLRREPGSGEPGSGEGESGSGEAAGHRGRARRGVGVRGRIRRACRRRLTSTRRPSSAA